MVSYIFRPVPLRSLASGNQLSIPVYHFEGGPGRRVSLQVQGIPVAYRLVEHLQTEPVLHGAVTFVPGINPAALGLKTNGLQAGRPASAHPQGQAVEYPVKVSEPGVLINCSRSQVVHEGIQIFSVLTHLKKV